MKDIGAQDIPIDRSAYLVDGKYSIRDLVDLEELKVIFARFTSVTGNAIGFNSFPDQDVLIGTGWQDVCTKFHRQNPEAIKCCLKSNIAMTEKLKKDGDVNVEPCDHGLVDAGTPVIIKGVHVATIVIGQVFFETPDLERFKAQAKKFGFDETAYLKAVKDVPVVSEKEFLETVALLGEIATFIARIGYANLVIREKNSELQLEVTTRKNAEDELRLSDERLTDALEVSELGIWGFDVKTGKAWRSLRHDQIFGYDKLLSEWTHANFLEHVLPEDRKAVDNKFSETLKHHMKWDFECRIRRVDGETRWIRAQGKPKFNKHHEATWMIGFVQDITDKKKYEENLKESEQKFRAMFDHVQDGILLVDPKTKKFHLANPAMCNMLGYTLKEIKKLGVLDIHPEENHPQVMDFFAKIVRKEDLLPKDVPVKRKDGSVFYADIHAMPLSIGDNGYVIGIFHDVTDRKVAGEALHESELKYRSLFEAVLDAVYIHDMDGNIVGVNDVACAMSGYSREELLGMNVRQLDTIENAALVEERIKTLLKNGKSSFETMHRRKDGSTFIYDVSASILDLDGGKAILSIGRDVTERKRVEEELRSLEYKFRSLFKSMSEGVALHEIIRDDSGKACDYRILDVNPAYEVITGIKAEDAIGKTAMELYGSNESPYLDIYAKVTEAGSPVSFDSYFKPMDRYFNVSVFTPEMNKFATVFLDISDRKKHEDELKMREEQLKLKLDSILSPDVDIGDQELANILDIPTVQGLMEKFTEITGMGTALIDLVGKVLVATGWQDICTQFHRLNPQSLKNCLESDLHLARNVKQGEYAAYKCKNGLVDLVTPLFLGGKHVGNIYTGQFLYDDEPVDESLFAKQAAKYDFDKKAYLDALSRVPRVSRKRAESTMDYLAKMAIFISSLSFSNLKLAKAITEQKVIGKELKEHIHDLEIFQRATIGREEKMIELKEENKRLKEKLEKLS